MAVVIIGKVIKIPIKTGTVFDLNQNKVNKIRETTGVALIIEREISKEREKAKRLRRIVAKRCFLKVDSVNNKKKRLKTEKGSGKTKSESMWFARIFQNIIMAQRGKTIIWKKSLIFWFDKLLLFKLIIQNKIQNQEVFPQ